MYPRDAFRAFNYSHSGFLTCSELYGGLDWLGLQLSPSQIYDIVLYIDADGDCLVSFDEFKRAFSQHEDGDSLDATQARLKS
jgi:Ca2+-binding EF-hand superfamily protein